jgi:hypothetical protein
MLISPGISTVTNQASRQVKNAVKPAGGLNKVTNTAKKTDVYQVYGSSKGAEFVTQLVKDIVKKAGNFLKNLFKK